MREASFDAFPCAWSTSGTGGGRLGSWVLNAFWAGSAELCDCGIGAVPFAIGVATGIGAAVLSAKLRAGRESSKNHVP